MDFSDISDTIIGLLIGGIAIWSYFIGPLIKKLTEKSGTANAQEHHRAATPRAAAKRPAPQPARTVAKRHIAEAGAFRPWESPLTEAPQPLTVETAPEPFISGEEGIRATSDADAGTEAQLAAMSTTPSAAAELLGSSPEDLRRGVIWAEILSPKFKD
ncbi:MAG: hypothetical protein K2L96_00845 [Muribaculaceae bacterium]|nr:hypothetical protein [Muribaculaceae bacterium]